MGEIYQFNRSERRKAKKDVKKALEAWRRTNREVENMTQVDFSGLKFPLIVLFNSPADFPGQIVARVFDTDRPTNIFTRYETLDEAREDAKAAGFSTVVPRCDKDDSAIVESYI